MRRTEATASRARAQSAARMIGDSIFFFSTTNYRAKLRYYLTLYWCFTNDCLTVYVATQQLRLTATHTAARDAQRNPHYAMQDMRHASLTRGIFRRHCDEC